MFTLSQRTVDNLYTELLQVAIWRNYKQVDQVSWQEGNFLLILFCMPKRTYQPKKLKRQRKHGFLKRASSAGGTRVIKRRRVKGRRSLTV